MRIGLRAVLLAVLIAALMSVSASAQSAPDSSFAQTAQASTDQYTNPNNGTNPSDQNQTTCSVVVENGRLVRVCNTTRQDLGAAVAASSLATARGGLAFTGLDLTVVLLLGASLVTAGVVIRVGSRRTRRNRSSA